MRDRTVARHPKTIFIVCHFGNQGNDLASLAKVIDQHPNMYADISARDYEIGRQPRYAAKWLAKYKDRVLFGTDQNISKNMYLSWWRLLETDDDYMPGHSWWMHYGLNLPASVLENLYRNNARKILNWEKL